MLQHQGTQLRLKQCIYFVDGSLTIGKPMEGLDRSAKAHGSGIQTLPAGYMIPNSLKPCTKERFTAVPNDGETIFVLVNVTHQSMKNMLENSSYSEFS